MKIFVIVLFALDLFGTIRRIGQPRDVITPELATINTALCILIILGIVYYM